MFRDNHLPLSEGEMRGLDSFIADIETHLRNREIHTEEYARYRAYFESLGGERLTTMPFPEGTAVIVKSYTPLTNNAYVQPVDTRRPLEKSEIRRYR